MEKFMKMVAIVSFWSILILSCVATGGCGVCGVYSNKLQRFPASAIQMPVSQLATVIPVNIANSATDAFARLYGTMGKFGFSCPIDNLLRPDTSALAYARIASIRSLDSGSNDAATDTSCATVPLYLAPGKYEFVVNYTWSANRWGSFGYRKVQLDAKAGRTYVLSGKVTNHGPSTSASFTFTEKP